MKKMPDLFPTKHAHTLSLRDSMNWPFVIICEKIRIQTNGGFKLMADLNVELQSILQSKIKIGFQSKVKIVVGNKTCLDGAHWLALYLGRLADSGTL